MGLRIMRAHVIRLPRLLNMLYRPSEIAEMIEVSSETVTRSYLASGAPFERDKQGNLWIHGTSFAEWMRSVSKRGKTGSLGAGEGWCFSCKKAVAMVRPRKVHDGLYTAVFQWTCSTCGGKVNRAYAAGDTVEDEHKKVSPTRAQKEKTGAVQTADKKRTSEGCSKRLICRENWMDAREYLDYLGKIGRDVESLKRIWGFLRHLVEWAGPTPLGQARQVDPSFQTYLLKARNDGLDKPLSAVSMKKACEYARRFFEWARSAHEVRYRKITVSWIETMRPSTARGMHSEFKEHQFYSLEDVRRLAAVAPRNLKEERDRAAACFLFLSAMRGQAFVSMPMKAVDLDRCEVDQFPELGVRTKNRKAARTQLLRIPELLGVVRAWQKRLIEAGLGPDDLWYPAVEHWNQGIGARRDLNWLSRRTVLGDGLRELCKQAGIEYLSPHKLRHGHAVYVMRRVKDMKQLKSLSQNLMHSSVAITDGIYGKLVSDDIAEMYESIGRP